MNFHFFQGKRTFEVESDCAYCYQLPKDQYTCGRRDNCSVSSVLLKNIKSKSFKVPHFSQNFLVVDLCWNFSDASTVGKISQKVLDIKGKCNMAYYNIIRPNASFVSFYVSNQMKQPSLLSKIWNKKTTFSFRIFHLHNIKTKNLRNESEVHLLKKLTLVWSTLLHPFKYFFV